MSTDDRPTVLLVQSDPGALGLYSEALNREGFVTCCESDGPSALVIARSADIIVTGVRGLGAIDGLELLTLLRSDEATRDKPIIVMTAWRIDKSRQAAFGAGCDAFLPKPCLPEELVTKVRRFLALARIPLSRETASCDGVDAQAVGRQSVA
jgi:two-component system, cell cycle response regulator DivK